VHDEESNGPIIDTAAKWPTQGVDLIVRPKAAWNTMYPPAETPKVITFDLSNAMPSISADIPL